MKNRTLPLSIVFSCMIIFISCGDNKNDDKQKSLPPQPVNVDVVKKGSAVYYDEYPSTTTALNQVDLRAQVTGYITGIYFKDGQHVGKGQKLYEIDRQQYRFGFRLSILPLL